MVLDDLTKDLHSYKRFHDFFIRDVKERKIETDSRGFTVPADSKILVAGKVHDN